MGPVVGEPVGAVVGERVEDAVGGMVGVVVGECVGEWVGAVVGKVVGPVVIGNVVVCWIVVVGQSPRVDVSDSVNGVGLVPHSNPPLDAQVGDNPEQMWVR